MSTLQVGLQLGEGRALRFLRFDSEILTQLFQRGLEALLRLGLLGNCALLDIALPLGLELGGKLLDCGLVLGLQFGLQGISSVRLLLASDGLKLVLQRRERLFLRLLRLGCQLFAENPQRLGLVSGKGPGELRILSGELGAQALLQLLCPGVRLDREALHEVALGGRLLLLQFLHLSLEGALQGCRCHFGALVGGILMRLG